MSPIGNGPRDLTAAVPSDASPTVSGVVVHFRGEDQLGRCLDACLVGNGLVEVIVVDNEGVGARLRRAHTDPRVRIVQIARNVGYGAAANVGLSLARSKAVLVLNQDVVLSPGSVDRMLGAGSKAQAWIVGPRLHDAEGSVAPFKSAFPVPFQWQPPSGPPGGGGWRYVPWIAGAAMLFMPGHTASRFDDRLFMYAEDEELCWRVWRDGGRVAIAVEASAYHESGSATRTIWTRAEIARRTVVNRGRMVLWHGGWSNLVRFAVAAVTTSAEKRLKRKDSGPVTR
jgi:N-acetylglucosaminyl-diphospho-decaprenol L-rhamnosyltransferase